MLLAGWQALLSRYTGATDVPVGTPISIRPDADFDGVAGLFLNTLVLRGDVSGDPDFRTLLSRTTECAFAGYENRDYPFERLVDKLADSRDLHGNPLFQVMIVLQNTPAPLTTAGGLRLVPLDLAPETAKFDLNLQLTEVDGRLRGDLDYAAELFDVDRVRRIAGHFRQLLAGAVADPGLPVSTLPLLTLDEQALLDSWNRTSTPAPYESLPSRFAAAAAAFPNRPAVGTEEEWLDYREFADRVARLASYLVAHGVRGGTVVGVCLPRSIDLVVALHAVHAAGGAYLPLDVDNPDARLQFMVSDARAAIVLTDDQHAATYAGSTATVLRPRPTDPPVFGADAVLQPDIGAKNREVAAEAAVPEPDELAYVIYTSGSTGKPKGVGVSHRAIANRISWMQRHFPLDGTDRVLQKTPASFDVSVWEFFWPLTVGASVLVAAPDGHRDSGYLARVIDKERVTTVHFVPSMLDAFVDEPELPQGLRRVFCSGEALPAELAGRCLDALPGTELHNLYGPTEAAVDVTWQPVRGLDLHRGVPIGKPVPNTTIEILDRHLARVPVGVPGELCIGGVQLARGYLGRPGLTADRFVPGPSGSRWYRTGDLARWRSDGRLEYLGRLDHQVKIRGVRIELGEIEAALVEQPEVRAAVVLVREGRLVAYLVADLSGRDSARVPNRWSERLRERLPSQMIPDRYVLLDRLPVTANGKLDRSALASPPRVVVDCEPPKPGTETLVAGIWQDVLGCERVSTDDDFFAVGGDSIRSLKVVSRLRTAGFTVALADLFRFRTVRDLAARLDAAGHDPGEPAHPTEAFGLLDPADRARLLGGAS